ncbi:hypothetical protein OAN33_05475 [Flavobacteriales bacterium]|nr:hypothetical protein [Flavobacteriales bacterium]
MTTEEKQLLRYYLKEGYPTGDLDEMRGYSKIKSKGWNSWKIRCVIDSFNHIPFFVSKWVSKQKHENYIVFAEKDTEVIRDGLPQSNIFLS